MRSLVRVSLCASVAETKDSPFRETPWQSVVGPQVRTRPSGYAYISTIARSTASNSVSSILPAKAH